MSDTIAAVDYETYYHKKTCSVAVQGAYGYCRHPEFDAYLVSVVTDKEQEFCGHPSEFDFDCVGNDKTIWLSHNKSFDWTVHMNQIERGVVSDKMPHQWYCTADLAAYHGLPRGLEPLLKYLYGHKMNKGVRDGMNGRRWEELTPVEKDEVIEYALEDSRWLHQLWVDLAPDWPEHERLISNLTIEMRDRGLPIDRDKLESSVKKLRTTMFEKGEEIPWWDGPTKTNKTPLSPKFMAEECRKRGIPAPVSRAKEDPRCNEWMAVYGKEHTFVAAMQDWNSCNALLKKLEVMKDRLVERGKGKKKYFWMPYGMKYCGTHTGRDSGSEGFNPLNMNRGEVYDVDLRSHITAPPGFKFLSADYSQIEPRVLAYLVQDEDMLEAMRNGDDPYVTFGTKTLGYEDWDKQDRQLWKIMVLQLGYGSGYKKFHLKANEPWTGLDMDLKEARRYVREYRAKNTKVTKFWKTLEREFVRSGKEDGWCNFELPSGRPQMYREITRLRGLQALISDEGWRPSKIYGGKLCENLVQAIARDVFFDGYLRLEANGLSSVLRVYDEFLVLVKEEEAEEKAKLMVELMRQAPEWAPDLPLEAECDIIDFYTK